MLLELMMIWFPLMDFLFCLVNPSNQPIGVPTWSFGNPSVAMELNSRVLIVPCESDNSNIEVVLPSGISQTVQNLTQYTTFMIEQADDLTGTVITSRSPLSVFVGHQCGQVPFSAPACDHLVEQVPAHAVYGNMFFALPYAQRESGDLFRIGSVTDNNEINITCTRRSANGSESITTDSVTINKGEFHSHTTLSRQDIPGLTSADYRRDFCCIETSKPATVMQYSLGSSEDLVSDEDIFGLIGDPAMSLVPPVEQYRNNYIVNTLDDVLDFTFERREFNSYISWAIASALFNPDINLMINDASYPPPSRAILGSGEYVPIRCSNGEVCGYGAFGPLQAGDSVISYNSPRDPSAALYASIYGFARENSYAYPAGYQCEPIGLPHITVHDITVSEEDGNIMVPFSRTGGDLSDPTRISVRTVVVADGRAQEDSDFTPIMDELIRWRRDAVDPVAPFFITITDDDTVESTEYLEVHFQVLNIGFAFPNTIARVVILDNDEATIGFFENETVVSENSSVVQLMVGVMEGNLQEIVNVNFTTLAGTAEAERDYNFTTVLLSFIGSQNQTINVSLIDDEEFEGDRTFSGQLELISDQPNVFLRNPTTTVVITDNEEAPVSSTEQASNSSTDSNPQPTSISNTGIIIAVCVVSAVVILVLLSVIITVIVYTVKESWQGEHVPRSNAYHALALSTWMQ